MVNTIPYPTQYTWFDRASNTNGWNLRDSNLDADFPTAANYAEQNYLREGGKPLLKGSLPLPPLSCRMRLPLQAQ